MKKKELKRQIADLQTELDRLKPPLPDKDDFDLTTTADSIRYCLLADLNRLIVYAHPDCAGPLWYCTLSGIAGIAGLCHGFSNPKRSFLKFVTERMEIDQSLAELLYLEKKAGQYSFFTRGIIIRTGPRIDEIFVISKKPKVMIFINVTALARDFLTAMTALELKDMPHDLPVLDATGIHGNALEYLGDKYGDE